MDRSLFQFNPQRDQLMQSLFKLREKYPDSFPKAWALSGDFFKDLSLLPDFDAQRPEQALEMMCMAYRFWFMTCVPPNPYTLGPVNHGMIMVDMARLGERPPSLASLMGIDEGEEWPEDER